MVKAENPRALGAEASHSRTKLDGWPTGQGASDEAPLLVLGGDGTWPGGAVESLLQGRGYRVRSAAEFDALMGLIHSEAPDLIVLGPGLKGGGSGLDLCRNLREREWLATTPILYLYEGGRAEAASALEAGAWGAVRCPPDPELLLARVRNAVHTKRQAESAMQRGLIDQLTGCYNRAGLITRLAEEMLHARRRKEPLAVLLAALEPVPELIRAQVGPDARESAYRMAAGLLRMGCRRSDILARRSELEFGIVAPATGRDGARKLVGRLCHAVENSSGQAKTVAKALRPSVGIAVRCSWSQEEETPETMLAEASEAMANARKWGLGYWVYDERTADTSSGQSPKAGD